MISLIIKYPGDVIFRQSMSAILQSRYTNVLYSLQIIRRKSKLYMKMNENGKTVAAVDCLVPGIGEIIGGSQREDDYDKLLGRMKELGLKEEDYEFYLDLRKYGSTRHAGFGLGFESCVMYLTGMSNIRDVIPFPRTVNNCEL
ncbi:MAG: amino acid--tRNA ligase-related protein [Mediterraneibacter faecis]